MSTLLKRETPVARKKHRCLFCGTAIKKGEKYNREVYATDEGFSYQKMHLRCYAAVEEFSDPYDEYLDVDYVMDRLKDTLRDNGIEPIKTIQGAVQQWILLRNEINNIN